MVLARGPATGVVIAQPLPLQIGGNLIELAVLFLLLAVVSAILGARGIAGVSMKVAKWLVIIFIVLAIVSVVL
ncbi:MAG: DUF1328 family protein [Haloarculaceae archaeon]